jgi:transposase-like protein
MTNQYQESAALAPGIIKIDESQVKNHLDDIVRGTVEETLNGLLDAEATALCQAEKHERTGARKDYRSGHYTRNLETKAGKVKLKVPKLRTLPFDSAIIQRYRTREISVEEALVEMYLAGVSVRRVEDITQALWGTRVSASTVSKLNKKIYGRIDEWRNRKIAGEYPYVFMDGIWLKRSWGGEVRNVAVLVAIGVNQDGLTDILGVVEGAKEDHESWAEFLRHLKSRGLKGVRMLISDKCLGLVDACAETYPDALWQRCTVHFYRNVFSKVPRTKMRDVAAMLKAIHAQESRDEASKKAATVVQKLRDMKLAEAAKVVDDGIHETLSYFEFPSEHWRRIRTNNRLKRLMKEIRRRTRVVGAFPDGESALMLVAARLRHVAGTTWSSRKYLNIDLLRETVEKKQIA